MRFQRIDVRLVISEPQFGQFVQQQRIQEREPSYPRPWPWSLDPSPLAFRARL